MVVGNLGQGNKKYSFLKCIILKYLKFGTVRIKYDFFFDCKRVIKC
jgi:hypothetical protein